MLRRTDTSPFQIQRAIRWFFFVALVGVAVGAILIPAAPLGPLVIFGVLLIALSRPAVALLGAWRDVYLPFTLSTLLDLAVAAAIYFMTGGSRGIGFLLLFPFAARAGSRLSLESALLASTAGSLIFSYDLWIPGAQPILGSNVVALGAYLAVTLGTVFVIHFALTGQREAQVRRETQSALAEARRIIDQEQMLVQLSRDITSTASLDETLHIVLETIHRSIPFKGGSISLIGPDNALFIAAAWPGVDESVRELRLPVGEGIAGWIVEKGEPYYSPDLDTEANVAPAFRRVGGNARIRSFLGVPLIAHGRCIGVLQVDSAELDAFSPDHMRLLQAVAAQVGGGIANAQLLKEREDFSVRLKAAYSAANELTSHFELDLILADFARHANDLITRGGAVAVVFDETGKVEKFATAGPVEVEGERLEDWIQSDERLRPILTGAQPLWSADSPTVETEPRKSGQGPTDFPVRLAAPLIARGETEGAILIFGGAEARPFTQREHDLLLILAAGASAAVSNARLYTQLRRNIEQLYALHQIGQAIGSSLETSDVTRVFNTDVRTLCGADASAIAVWNGAGNRLTAISREGDASLIQARDLPQVQAVIDRAVRTNQALSLSVPLPDGGGTLYGYLAPLNVRGRTLGLAEIYARSPAVHSSEASSIFLTLTAQLAVSMENASLYTQLQKREQQLRNFVARLFQAEDGERRRLAYDIHDGLAQLIVSADMHMSNFASVRAEDPQRAEQQLEKGLSRLEAALTEVRRVVSELRPSTLDDFGLVNTLRRFVEQLAEEQEWDYHFEENLGDLRLDAAIETGAYRIVQESLSNIRKYSDTPRVDVSLRQDGEQLHIRVQDWGRGFDLEEARQREGHFGLSSMEERARLLGGTFHIETRPGQGTRVDVDLPCYRAVPNVQA